MVLPAFGIISEVIPVFSRKPIFGYGSSSSPRAWRSPSLASGSGPTTCSRWAWLPRRACLLWRRQHDDRRPHRDQDLQLVATMWGGHLRFTTPMLFATAFIAQFTIGGITGVQFANVPIDWQTTDTYYVVAHFHYVLFGGTAFAIFAGAYYWFPKMTGRMLGEKPRQMALLADFHWLQSHLLPHAHPRTDGDAASRLYLPRPARLGTLNTMQTIGAFVLPPPSSSSSSNWS